MKEFQGVTSQMVALSRFISRSGEHGLPLFKVIRKHDKFQWSDEVNKTFEDIKTYLASLPILVSPYPGGPLLVYWAVTPYVVSIVLIAEQDNANDMFTM